MKLSEQLLESIVGRLNKLEDVVDEVRWYVECMELSADMSGNVEQSDEMVWTTLDAFVRLRWLLAELDE